MGSQLKIHQLEMKVLIVLAAALVATQALDLDLEWESFKIKYGKNLLTGQEHDIRKNIFAANLKFIEKHNAEHALGLHTFTVGINQFADLTNEEFVKQFTGFAAADDVPESLVEIIGDRPESIDWREEGAVTPVKNQGQCGSCWAFSTIGTIEGAHFKETGKLVSLSEQNLMDCSRANYGCNGGFPYEALRYVINNGGVDTEESYPYEMRQGYCRYNENNIGAKISQAKKIVQGSEEDLQNALGSIGPISVAIDASHIASSCITVECTMSHIAHHTDLIMVSWLLDMDPIMDRTTILSRTPGDQIGDWEATSKCPGTAITSVVLLPWLAMLLPKATNFI